MYSKTNPPITFRLLFRVVEILLKRPDYFGEYFPENLWPSFGYFCFFPGSLVLRRRGTLNTSTLHVTLHARRRTHCEHAKAYDFLGLANALELGKIENTHRIQKNIRFRHFSGHRKISENTHVQYNLIGLRPRSGRKPINLVFCVYV